MAEVGSCDDHGIHITLLQQIAEPGELPGFVAELCVTFSAAAWLALRQTSQTAVICTF